mgnify:FL=1
MEKICLSQRRIDEIKNVCRKYGNDPGELINILHGVQDTLGYLPKEVQELIALELGISAARVYGVVSFYSFFTMKPKGKYPISVCMGTACYVRGGEKVLDEFRRQLGIEVGGTTGTVREISLTHTKIETPDGQIVLQPNREMSSSKIINFTVLGRRRIVYKVTASYDAPTDEVKRACMDAVLAFPAVLKEPTPTVYLSNYGASSIEYTIRCWTAADAYWDTYFKMYERLRNTFAKHNVEMSYDHLNIHVVPEKQNEN